MLKMEIWDKRGCSQALGKKGALADQAVPTLPQGGARKPGKSVGAVVAERSFSEQPSCRCPAPGNDKKGRPLYRRRLAGDPRAQVPGQRCRRDASGTTFFKAVLRKRPCCQDYADAGAGARLVEPVIGTKAEVR